MERQLLPGPSLLDHPLGASATTAWSPESGAVWTAGRRGGQTGATRRCAERMLAQLMEAGRTVLHSESCNQGASVQAPGCKLCQSESYEPRHPPPRWKKEVPTISAASAQKRPSAVERPRESWPKEIAPRLLGTLPSSGPNKGAVGSSPTVMEQDPMGPSWDGAHHLMPSSCFPFVEKL